MSRMEFHKGTAIEVSTGAKGLRAKAKQLLNDKAEDILDDWSEEDKWLEITNPSYVYLRDRDELYVLDGHVESETGINQVTSRIDFFVRRDFILSFYNGGASFEEALSAAIEKESSS